MWLYSIWEYVFQVIVWPTWKWILHRLTGKCELLRILDSQPVGAGRTHKIEWSLKHSKSPVLQAALTEKDENIIEKTVVKIMEVKGVKADLYPQFQPALKQCLLQISGYNILYDEVDSIRRTPFSCDSPGHEDLLMQVWHKLKPESQLEGRISKQWGDIGFQGDDPATDFRGMGLLGLQNLVFFISEHTDQAQQLFSKSQHPQYGYPFAITGINITALTFELLKKEHLKTHFFNAVTSKPQLKDFHQLYCYLLKEFDSFWFEEKPRDIMEFNIVKEKFKQHLIERLKERSCTLS